MAISNDYILVDTLTDTMLGADAARIVPAVWGEAAYSISYDADAAIGYADQGLELSPPDAEGIPVDELEGYLIIDGENGYIAQAEDVVMAPYDGNLDDLDMTQARVPVAPQEVRDLPGLPFESVNN